MGLVMRLGVWGLVTSFAVSAEAQHTKSGNEDSLKPLDWTKIALVIDQERSKTMHSWWTRYAQDRNKEVPPYNTLRSLQTSRKLDLAGVDRCLAEVNEREASFGDMISRSVDLGLDSRRIATNTFIDAENAYHLSPSRISVGLRSHPFCVSEEPAKFTAEFKHSISARVQPDAKLASDLNDYLLHGNHLLNQVNEAKSSTSYAIAVSELKAYQGIMMSCLAYTESLVDTESERGSEIFADLRRRAYVTRPARPEGVSIGMDRPQDYFVGGTLRREQLTYGLPESLSTYKDKMNRDRPRYFKYSPEILAEIESHVIVNPKTNVRTNPKEASIKRSYVSKQLAAYNAAKAAGATSAQLHEQFFSDISQTSWVSSGVFQFKFANLDTEKGDELSSNIGPCVDQWNALYGNSCPIQHTIAGYAQALTSPGQAFNIFCGVQKIVQSYNTQVHTMNPKKTSPQNMGPDGNLLPPEKRCVHPFWHGSLGYNHFGPLANSAPKDSIKGLPSYPGNLALLMECVHNNGMKIFGGR